MQPTVRPCRDEDRAAVEVLADRLTAGVAPWRDPAHVLTAVRGWIASSLDDPDVAVLVAEIGCAVIGFVTVTEQAHWSGEADAYIGELVVDSGHEGGGVGQALVSAAEDWARSHGLQRIRLATGAANTGALRLYDRLGYEREDITLSKALPSADE